MGWWHGSTIAAGSELGDPLPDWQPQGTTGRRIRSRSRGVRPHRRSSAAPPPPRRPGGSPRTSAPSSRPPQATCSGSPCGFGSGRDPRPHLPTAAALELRKGTWPGLPPSCLRPNPPSPVKGPRLACGPPPPRAAAAPPPGAPRSGSWGTRAGASPERGAGWSLTGGQGRGARRPQAPPR